MKKHYDFSTARPNPYAKRLKRQLTIRMDPDTLGYFQGLAAEYSMPYQTLMNMFLRECAARGLRPAWMLDGGTKSGSAARAVRTKRRAG